MSILTEDKRTAEFIVSEANGFRSREEVTVTVAANTTIPAGRIMGVTATGKYVPHIEAAADGSENPRALLYSTLTNDTGASVDVAATVVIRDAEYRISSITHDPARDDAGKANDRDDLAAFGLIGR